jgi:integrase
MHTHPNGEKRSVRNRPGIFVRETARGERRYMVFYRDSDGRQRWKTVGPSLREAIAFQDEVRSKKRKGERVVPSKATLAEVADQWLAAQHRLRPRTRETYATSLRVHVLPRLGPVKDRRADHGRHRRLILAMQEGGSAGWTIRGALSPLSRVLGHAARRGLIAENPMTRLERGERPAIAKREMRILDRAEIEGLLAAANDTKTPYRTLIATAVFTGLRQGELLGLTWGDIDFDRGVVRVRKQLDRSSGERVEPKTPAAIREVLLFDGLAALLKAHRERAFALGRAGHGDLVFAAPWSGGPLSARNVAKRGLEKALERAGLNGAGRPRLRWHDLRHTFASLLIAGGHNVTFVSRQLGHASPSITLNIYAHEFDQASHAERARDEMQERFGGMLAAEGGAAVVPLPEARL